MIMVTTIPKIKHTSQQSETFRGHTPGETNELTSTPWYYGILKEDTTTKQDFKVQVVDNGGSIEFVLPEGTAQFAEMFVLDTRGNLVWKTQSFNTGKIVWDKQTIFGGRVPGGTYTFLMKQSNRQMNGTIEISQ
jgi:hypothetical protein